MHFINEVIDYVANQPSSTWTTVGSYLGGSAIIASVVQVLKHKLNFKEAKGIVTAVLGFFSFIAAFADFLLQQNAKNPLPTISHTTGLLLGGAVVVHRFAVSPAYYALSAKLSKWSDLLSELSALQAQKKAAAKSADPVQSPDEANLAQFQVQ